MTRVLEIISDTNIGGAGSVLLSFLRFYDSSSFEIAVALPKGSDLQDRPELEGIKVFVLENLRDKSFDVKAIRELRQLIREYKPDVVHTHGAFSGRIAARRAGVPAVFTKHSAFAPSSKLTRFPGKQLFTFVTLRYAKRIIAVAPVCAEGLITCGVPKERIDVILNGAPALKIPENRESLRAAYCPEDTFLAGIVARVELYKGQDVVIRAARILKSRGRDFVILLAGTGSYLDEAKQLAAELEVLDCVKFLGFVADVATLMGALDVQINASRVEACSMSLIEGMSLGLPAVASDAGGNPLLIKDGGNGLLFRDENAEELAEKLEQLMDSKELRGRISKTALRIYNSNYTGERTARETEAVYRKCLIK